MGVGLAIQANSRPYESLFFGLPIAGALLVWMLGKNRPSLQMSMRRGFFPLVLGLVLTVGVMGYYFWGGIGNPFPVSFSGQKANLPLVCFSPEKVTPPAEYPH